MCTKERMSMLEKAKMNILKAQERQKKNYDKKHSCPEVFKLGSLVLKKDFRRKKRKGGKLDLKWEGPYKISRILGRGLYQLQDFYDSSKTVSRVNGVHLKKYILKSPEVRTVCMCMHA